MKHQNRLCVPLGMGYDAHGDETRKYPLTLAQFVASPKWMGKLTTAINQYRNIPADQNDLMQGVLTAMAEKKWIERYDPSMGASFSLWLYRFVNNYLKAVHKHHRWDSVRRVERGPSTDERDTDGHRLYDVADRRDDHGVVDADDALSRIVAELSKPGYRHHSESSTGVPRSALEWLRLTLDGHTVAEIAERMEVSGSFVGVLRKKVQHAARSIGLVV